MTTMTSVNRELPLSEEYTEPVLGRIPFFRNTDPR